MKSTNERDLGVSPLDVANGSANQESEFDGFAAAYDDALTQGIAVSGESKEFFAKGRVLWLEQCLRTLSEQPQFVMDFGCGTGTSVQFLREHLKARSIIGVDVSAKSLDVARSSCSTDYAQFYTLQDYEPNGSLDLAFCNGVFHHIPLSERDAAVHYVLRSLRPGGLFSFWENNPWNAGTRYVMSRIPFDRDAITLSPPGARRMLQTAGFDCLKTDFHFIFPRSLGFLRGIERSVSNLPLGAQYQVLCRKPETSK